MKLIGIIADHPTPKVSRGGVVTHSIQEIIKE